MTENKNISWDFTFSFGAIEPKRKHRIERISREGKFMIIMVIKVISFAMKLVMKSLNSKKLAKI